MDVVPFLKEPSVRYCPSANSSIIFLLNACKSSGLLLVTKPLSETTSLSSQITPAFLNQFLSMGKKLCFFQPTFQFQLAVVAHGK